MEDGTPTGGDTYADDERDQQAERIEQLERAVRQRDALIVQLRAQIADWAAAGASEIAQFYANACKHDKDADTCRECDPPTAAEYDEHQHRMDLKWRDKQ